MTSTVNYTYRYPFESAVLESEDKPAIRLATSLDGTSDDTFFDGAVRHPATFGNLLSVLSTIVRTRFYERQNLTLLDPVVTSGGGMLRFEGFSGCCGVYSRVDLHPDAFDVELRGKGTTNVDFNDAMRTSLRRMRNQDDTRLQVGGEGLTLRRDGDTIVERRVRLPVRWIKGFCEVQAYQPRMTPHFELSAMEARDLFRGLPRGRNSQGTHHLTRTGRVLRLASRASAGSVRLEGAERVRVLEPLLPYLQKLVVWYDTASETSGWELQFETGRIFSLVSPELSRGFSGEGQMLERLATGQWQAALPVVTDTLNWQSQIDSGALGVKSGLGEAQVESALAVLGSRGLVGFDVTTSRYFHRVLPFDLDQLGSNQPRLKAARQLVADHGVRPAIGTSVVDSNAASGGPSNWLVQGTGVEHFVRLRPEGDRCTCQWFNRYQGNRGPCKHILAARLLVDGENSQLIEEDEIHG
ncbi:MAG: SWIM zinc finger family protein [Planctomycetaceae bacterium]|nr:SWIM zinc finger family protein [Planctomycetaceae bacterium]